MQRMFEFQFQGKFLKQPQKNVFLGIQFDRPSKMGMIQRTLVNLALAFVRKVNKGCHFCQKQSITETPEEIAEGMYEKPHIAFPLQTALDRLVVTPPGSTLPPLGGEIYESEESVKRRKKGAPDSFTYWRNPRVAGR